MFPIHKEEIDGTEYQIGYKVVTEDLRSLGLRRNPNIYTFPIKEWYHLDESEIKKGPDHYGGIWVARTLSHAKKIIRDIHRTKNPFPTRIFKTAIDEILYCNERSIKTNSIMLLEEI